MIGSGSDDLNSASTNSDDLNSDHLNSEHLNSPSTNDEAYDPNNFPAFAVTVDLVVLTVRPPSFEVLLLKRPTAPEKGKWALPGGFVQPDQDLINAAEFKLADKTGIVVDRAHLEQLQTFGAPQRDKRMRIVSVAYLAMVADPPTPELANAQWVPIDVAATSELAFDHLEILSVGVERARSKLEYTTLATTFCGGEFTIAQLRAIYEAVWATTLDPANFHRKVVATDGFVEPTGNSRSDGPGRPATTYRAGGAIALHPPIPKP